ncbi:MAG: hypothetical protein JXB49_31390 [Bacteroidales bacterium]|nr:hypothetical protein [Bacteroidales bacterium]
MGILSGSENIIKAVGYVSPIQPEDAIKSFEVLVFNLMGEAYNYIRIPNKQVTKIDEPQISISMYEAIDSIISKKGLWCGVSWEYPEVTESVEKNAKTAKRFDIHFENWDTKNRIKYGIEAKILVENDTGSRKASQLVKEYISDAGMGKYINGIYKGRGCMVAYILNGSISSIVIKINEEIKSNLDQTQCLSKATDLQYIYNEIFQSTHKPNLQHFLYHIMLDFN